MKTKSNEELKIQIRSKDQQNSDPKKNEISNPEKADEVQLPKKNNQI
jgi:hypothetical protein